MNLVEKITEIRKKVGTIEKSTEGFKFKYATLPDVVAQLDAALVGTDVIYEQSVNSDEKGVLVTTTIWFAGEEATSRLYLPWDKVELPGMTPVQSMGGVITYLRRYSLVGAFNLMSEEDADQKSAEREKKVAEKKPLSEEEKQAIKDLLTETETDHKTFLEYYQKSSLDDFSSAEFRSILSVLNNKKIKMGKGNK